MDENILFIGGKNANKNSFIFNHLNYTISKADGDNEKMVFEDKTFYRINNFVNIAIP